MLKCSGCGKKTKGQVLSPGCTSAKCDKCYADPTSVPADRTGAPRARQKAANRRPADKPKRARKS